MKWVPVLHEMSLCCTWNEPLWCMKWAPVIHEMNPCGAWNEPLWYMKWWAFAVSTWNEPLWGVNIFICARSTYCFFNISHKAFFRAGIPHPDHWPNATLYHEKICDWLNECYTLFDEDICEFILNTWVPTTIYSCWWYGVVSSDNFHSKWIRVFGKEHGGRGFR